MYPHIPQEMITEAAGHPHLDPIADYIHAMAEATDNFVAYRGAGALEHEDMDAYITGYIDATLGAEVAKEMMQDIEEFHFRVESMQRDMTDPEIEDYVDFAINGQHS
jgi:hypothetical protein